MPKFLTTRNVTSTLENIISDANEKLVLFSPYVFIPKNLADRLKDAVERKVDVTLVTRGEFRDPEIRKWEYIGFKVLVNYDLHAKAYYNEREAIITSFNLIDSSERYNIEFGMSVTKQEEDRVYSRIVSECDMVIRKSTPLSISNGKYSLNDKNLETKIERDRGYCIRCHTSIEQNILKPFCLDCYTNWNNYKNPAYVERFCNRCGKSYPSSLKFPLCDECQEHNDVQIK
jgi:hypothetical protein